MKRVLVVDDEAGMRLAIKEALLRKGYEPVLAENGMEALEKTRTAKPDLILAVAAFPFPDQEYW